MSCAKKEIVNFSPAHAAVNITKYKEMVEERILELTQSDNILQKIKEGKTVSEQEAEELAQRLHEEHPNITLALLQRIYQNQKGKFIQFIKHILGIEILESFPTTVSTSIDLFIQEHNYLSARQLEFLNLLRDYLIERGNIQKRDLIHAPFTLIHPNGIRGVFSKKEIAEIVSLTEKLVA